jgi:DNA-binding NarL/FixJ family response regulator
VEREELQSLLREFLRQSEVLHAQTLRRLEEVWEARARAWDERLSQLEDRLSRLEDLVPAEGEGKSAPREWPPPLAEREAEVLRRAQEGQSAQEIALAQRRSVGEVELILRLLGQRAPVGQMGEAQGPSPEEGGKA